MSTDKKNDMLPPRPTEKPIGRVINSRVVALYINGNLIETSYTEALGVLAQISQILLYFDQQERSS